MAPVAKATLDQATNVTAEAVTHKERTLRCALYSNWSSRELSSIYAARITSHESRITFRFRSGQANHARPHRSRRRDRATRTRARAFGRAGCRAAPDARAWPGPGVALRASGRGARRSNGRAIFFLDCTARERSTDATPHGPSGILGLGFRSHA